MKKVSLPIFCVIVLCGFIGFAQAQTNESLTITTYYPAPTGVYNNLRLFPTNTVPGCNVNSEGLMYYNNTSNQTMLCQETTPGVYSWQNIGGGLWQLNDSKLYPTNSLWKVGIGTTNPGAKLHLATLPSGGAPGSYPQLRLEDLNGPWDLWGGANFHIIDANATGNDFEKTRVVIGSNGYVRIGKMFADGSGLPWTNLHIYDDSSVNIYGEATAMELIENPRATGTTASALAVLALKVKDRTWQLRNEGAGDAWGGNGLVISEHTDSPISGAARVSINQGGNVGIGLAYPDEKLVVSGNIKATGTFKGMLQGRLYDRGGDNGFSVDWAGSPAELRFYIEDTQVAAIKGFSAVKSFVINHPLDDSKYLIHATLEGPEGAVYYRGSAKLANGQAEIALPDYFEALTRKEARTIILTNIDGFDRLAVKTTDGAKIKDGKFIVISDNSKSAQEFDWEVKAVRADVAPLAVERDKNSVSVEGSGPYTYIVPKK